MEKIKRDKTYYHENSKIGKLEKAKKYYHESSKFGKCEKSQNRLSRKILTLKETKHIVTKDGK
jgi:hypothetical protein